MGVHRRKACRPAPVQAKKSGPTMKALAFSRAVVPLGLMLVAGMGRLRALAAPDETPRQTSLSDPQARFTVPDKPYAVLHRAPLEAVVVDNRAVDDEVLPGHRAGYHGLGSLRHDQQSGNLFVPD